MEGRGAGMDFAYRWLEVESARGRGQSDLCDVACALFGCLALLDLEF